MRVLVVGRGAPERGGIPTFLAALVDGELASRHEFDFLNLAQEGTAGGQASTANAMRTARDLRAVLERARHADVVHLHSALAPGSTLLRAGALAAAARLRGRPVLVHAHGGAFAPWLSSPSRERLARLTLRAASHVAAVSTGAAAALGRVVGSSRLSLVDNGVDVGRFGPAPAPHDGPPRVLFVGGMTPRKGVLDLLAASRRLSDEGVEHELRLAGGTPNEGAEHDRDIHGAVASTPRARALGAQPPDAMPDLYRSVDVFCLPSWWEAMPLSVLEAMASGLPVVATRVGDVARLVDDGVTGMVVEPKQPDELTRALAAVLTDAGRRQAMGLAGRAKAVDAFPLSATLRAIDDLYAAIGRGSAR